MLFWSAAGALCCAFLLGGGVARAGWAFDMVVLTGLWLLCVVSSRGAFRKLWLLSWPARLIIFGVMLLPLMQLVPLPPQIWSLFPGRGMEQDVIALVGEERSWLPLTLSGLATAQAVFMTILLLGMFLAGMVMTSKDATAMVFVMAALLLAAVTVGVLQLVSGGSQPVFHEVADDGLLIGFFANHNHMAVWLCCGILIGGLLAENFKDWRMSVTFVGCWSALMLAALIGTASRAGIALCLVAILLSGLWLPRPRRWRRGLVAGFLLLCAGTVMLLSFSGVFDRAVARFDNVGGDLRWQIWEHSWVLAQNYFPFGTGMATFPDVYMAHEKLDWLLPQYINHAHNDFLELVIEGGIAAALLVAGFLAVWARSSVLAMRWAGQRPQAVEPRIARVAAGIILLLLLHSCVDYPLRTPALAALFALCFGWLVRWASPPPQPEA